MGVSLIHQHLIAKCYTNKFPKKGEEQEIAKWLETLVTDILGMKICIPPQIAIVEEEGNYGHTGCVGLTTSHAAFHDFPEYGYFQLDVYSCKSFDISKVFDFIKETRAVNLVSYSSFDRDRDTDYVNTCNI